MLVISKRFPSLIKEGVLWISDGFKLAIAFRCWGLKFKGHIFTKELINGRNLRHCYPHLLFPFLWLEVMEKRLYS